jgi:hypothetical protein
MCHDARRFGSKKHRESARFAFHASKVHIKVLVALEGLAGGGISLTGGCLWAAVYMAGRYGLPGTCAGTKNNRVRKAERGVLSLRLQPNHLTPSRRDTLCSAHLLTVVVP